MKALWLLERKKNMTSKFSIKLPYPPTQNKRKNTAYGRTYIAKQHKEYKKKIVTMIKLKYPNFDTFTKPVRVNVSFFVPDKRRRDEDNLHKDLMDALTEAKIYADDSLARDKRTLIMFNENIKNCLFIEVFEI